MNVVSEKIKEILNDPNGVYERMMKTNPDFRKFVEDNKHKTTEELIKEHNLEVFLKWKN